MAGSYILLSKNIIFQCTLFLKDSCHIRFSLNFSGLQRLALFKEIKHDFEIMFPWNTGLKSKHVICDERADNKSLR